MAEIPFSRFYHSITFEGTQHISRSTVSPIKLDIYDRYIRLTFPASGRALQMETNIKNLHVFFSKKHDAMILEINDPIGKNGLPRVRFNYNSIQADIVEN